MWLSIIATIVGGGGLTTVGIIVDRPAMFSELQTIAEQSVENAVAILIIQRADIQKRIWRVEDLIIEGGMTEDRKQRLWELRNEYDRLERQISELLYDGSEL